jgi:hypothetical protein
MANEITLNATLTLNNGNLRRTLTAGTIQITQSVARTYSNTQILSTSEEDIAIGSDISTLGVAWLENYDDTNTIKWGPSSGGSMVAAGRLKPGEKFPIRLEPGTTYRAAAVAGTPALGITVHND